MTLKACCMRRQSCARRTPGIFGRLIVAAINLSSIAGTVGVASASFQPRPIRVAGYNKA